MTEEPKIENAGQPYCANENAEAEQTATTPIVPTVKPETTVSVKFNKKVHNLSLEEAAVLAQKGLKYDTVEADLSRLRALACEKGQNITDYITDIENRISQKKREDLQSRCSDEELVEHILTLESGQKSQAFSGFDELIAAVPEIKCEADVPEPVLEAVRQKGGNIFNEYLRYRYSQEKLVSENEKKRSENEQATAGSQIRHSENGMSEDACEFIKGLWSK